MKAAATICVHVDSCKLIHSCNSKISLAFSQAAPWMLRDGAAKRKAKELHVDAKRREPPKHCNQRELKKSTKSAKPSTSNKGAEGVEGQQPKEPLKVLTKHVVIEPISQ